MEIVYDFVVRCIALRMREKRDTIYSSLHRPPYNIVLKRIGNLILSYYFFPPHTHTHTRSLFERLFVWVYGLGHASNRLQQFFTPQHLSHPRHPRTLLYIVNVFFFSSFFRATFNRLFNNIQFITVIITIDVAVVAAMPVAFSL